MKNMNIQWVSYTSLGRNLQEDMEKIILYNNPLEGVCLGDIYRYIADISFIYANLYVKINYQSDDKEDVDFVFSEIYRQNEEYWEKLRKSFFDKQYIDWKKAEDILTVFKVPKI